MSTGVLLEGARNHVAQATEVSGILIHRSCVKTDPCTPYFPKLCVIPGMF